MIPFWEKKKKKKEEKQISATIIISLDGKGTVFPMKLKLQGITFENPYWKKKILKKI